MPGYFYLLPTQLGMISVLSFLQLTSGFCLTVPPLEQAQCIRCASASALWYTPFPLFGTVSFQLSSGFFPYRFQAQVQIELYQTSLGHSTENGTAATHPFLVLVLPYVSSDPLILCFHLPGSLFPSTRGRPCTYVC